MAESGFVVSPLMTPERLLADRRGAFSIAPDWAKGGAIIAPDLPLEDDAFVVRVGAIKPVVMTLHVPSAGILFELTRFGNSITTNRNSSSRDPAGRIYPKLTFADHPEDTMPVSRIVLAAGPHQSVRMGEDTGDLRPSLLSLQGAGKPTKDAREVAIRHSVALAQRAAADVHAYERNLHALFLLHDELLLGTAGY